MRTLLCASLLIMLTAPAVRAATDAEIERGLEQMRRLQLAARTIEDRVERAAALPPDFLGHMADRGFSLRSSTAYDRRDPIWIIDTRVVPSGCEAYTSFLLFPADASEDAMRGYLSRINLGSFLNAPARIAMFYPRTQATRSAITSCVGERSAHDAFVKRLIAAFNAYALR